MHTNKQVQGCSQGSEALVFLMQDGVAVRKPKHPAVACAMRESSDLLRISQHPNLVRILKIQDSVIYMERMQTSLQQHLPAGKTYSFHIKRHIALAIVHGMHHLHTHGLDHGDLCPSNILLTWTLGEMHVKLCDFFSKHSGIRRTAAYAAPEVVLHPQDLMFAADVWAFACCILFLEGVEPFHGFDDDAAKLYYLGLHQCIAFKEDDACKQFKLQHCAYAPAKHIGDTVWAEMLADIFVPEASRMQSHEVLAKLAQVASNKAKTRTPFRRLN